MSEMCVGEIYSLQCQRLWPQSFVPREYVERGNGSATAGRAPAAL